MLTEAYVLATPTLYRLTQFLELFVVIAAVFFYDAC